MLSRRYFSCLTALFAMLYGVTRGDLLTDIEICRPQQVHLSYGDSTAEVIVMWSTNGQCSAIVKYGEEINKLEHSVPGESRHFSVPWNKKGAQYIHKVKLRSLNPNTRFFYQPISNRVPAGPYIFKTPPSSTDAEISEIHILALGDLKTSSPVFTQLRGEVETGKYAAIIHPGNMAMNLSQDGGKNGDLYMKMMESMLKEVPYLVSPGPAESDNGTFSHYLHRFSMPFTEWPMTTDKIWYSVDIGPVHLVSFSTEVLYTDGGKFAESQKNWLITDLKVANDARDGNKVPWIVAFAHRPMYCASEDPNLRCNKRKSQMELDMEDLMYHYGVDVIFFSNGQGYEVSYPMYKGVKVGDDYTDPLAPVHVTLGSASPWKADYNFTKNEWLNILNDDESPLTFGRLQIFNSSLLRVEIVSFQGLKVLDSFEIVQDKHGGFLKNKLPANISAKIDKKIIDSGGKPGVMNINEATSPKPVSTIAKIHEILQGDNKNKIIIGVSVAGVILIIVIAILIVRKVMRGRRRHSTRRWENIDINYGKRYYNKAPDKDDLDNDFEIDMTETTTPSKKLLSDD